MTHAQGGRILITGAGSGLGEAMARRFGTEGWAVMVTDREGERAETVAGAIRDAGGRAEAMALDVTREADFKTAAESVREAHGGLDVLVNNAGVAVGGTLLETPAEDWSWVMEINLMGTVHGCRHLLPLIEPGPRAHVINVASFAGLAAAPGIAAYGVSKSAVVALSEMLRAEMHSRGVRVSVLCPAFVQTRLLESFRASDPRLQKRVARWMENSPVAPEDVAGMVYRAVGRRRFLLLTHGNTRWLWRFRRFFPGLYARMMVRMAGGRRRTSSE